MNVERETKTVLTAEDRTGRAFASMVASVKGAQGALMGMHASLLSVAGALTGGMFAMMVKGNIDATARFKDLGLEAGTSASAISKFEASARMAGMQLDAVSGAIFKVSKAVLEAQDPASAAAQAFRAIGIEAQQLRGLKPEEMFEKVARQAAKYTDGLEKNAVMQELFGKSGREMNRLLAQIAESGELVATVTDQQADAADKLGDDFTALQMKSEKFWRDGIGALTPALQRVLDAFVQLRGQKDGTVGFFEAVGSAVKFLAGVMGTLWLMVQSLGDGIGAFFATIRAKSDEEAALIQRDRDQRKAEISRQSQELWKNLFKEAEATTAVAQAQEKLNYDPNAGKRAADAAKEMERAMGVYERLTAAEAGVTATFSKDLNALHALFKTGRLDLEQYGGAVQKLIDQQPYYRRGLEEEARLLKHTADWHRQVEQAKLDEMEGYDRAIDALEDSIHELEREAAMLGMTDLERQKYLIGLEEEAALHEAVTDGQRDHIKGLAGKKRALLDQNAALTEQTALWDRVATGAGQFFGELVTRGASAFDRLKEMLRSFVAELIALFAKKWILNLAASATGNAGLAQLANSAGQGTMAGNLLGGAGLLSNLSGMAATGLNALGMGSASQFMVGLGGNFVGPALPGSALAMGQGAASALSAAGPIALAIAASVMSYKKWGGAGLLGPLAGMAFGRKREVNMDAGGFLGSVGFGTFSGQNWQDKSQRGGWFRSDKRWTELSAMSGEQAGGYESLMAAMRGALENIGALLGRDASALLAGFTRDFKFETKDTSPEEVQRQINAFFDSVFRDQLGLVLDGQADDLRRHIDGFTGTTEELIAFAQGLAAVAAALPHAGHGLTLDVLTELAQGGEDVVQTFARVMSALDAAVAVFDTEADQLNAAQRMVEDYFAALNMAVPASEAAFRAWIQTLDLSTEAGRNALNTLGQVPQAFAQIEQSIKQSIQGIWSAASSVLGGQFGQAFARAKLEATYAQWQALEGTSYTFDDMLAHFNYIAQQGPGYLQQGIANVQNQYGAAGVQLLNQLFSDYAAYSQSLGQSTQTFTNAVGGATGTINDFASSLASANGSLVEYLNGLNQSDLSPFNGQQRYQMASEVFWQQIGLAEGGNLGALQNIQGYHQQFLQASQGANASNPMYVADYLDSYNRLNALTGNQAVQPLTVAVYQAAQAETQALLKTMTEQNAENKQMMMVVVNAIAADEGLKTRDPELAAAVQRLALAVETPGSL